MKRLTVEAQGQNKVKIIERQLFSKKLVILKTRKTNTTLPRKIKVKIAIKETTKRLITDVVK